MPEVKKINNPAGCISGRRRSSGNQCGRKASLIMGGGG